MNCRKLGGFRIEYFQEESSVCGTDPECENTHPAISPNFVFSRVENSANDVISS